MNPERNISYYWCARFYADRGRFNEALSLLETQIKMMDDDNISDEIALIGYIYGKTGQNEKAQLILKQLDDLASEGFYVSPRTHVLVYLGINDIDKAMDILEEAYSNHSLIPWNFQDFPLDQFRNNSRVSEFLKEAGLD